MADETRTWTCLAVADFEIPAPPAGAAARGGLLQLWNSLPNVFHRTDEYARKEDRPWEHLPAEVLQSVAPDPNWAQAATGLATALGDDWFAQRLEDRRVQTLIGPPGCGTAEVLRELAEQQPFQVIGEPSAEGLRGASSQDVSALATQSRTEDEILVLPNLERWFLRHEDGLSLVRELIEWLGQCEQRVLIGCDSWAWAFLQHALGIEDRFGVPWTWAAFDATRLDAWLRSLLDLKRYTFRQNEDGESVFPKQGKAGEAGGEQPQSATSSTAIRSLAAWARGNPGVALALWRDRLRTQAADTTVSDRADDTSESVIWVTSLAEISVRNLPIHVDRDLRLILHAVLLHGGLSFASLLALLPLSPDQIQRRVSVLRQVRMLEQHEGRLRVSLTVYPLVRADLVAEGFLADAF